MCIFISDFSNCSLVVHKLDVIETANPTAMEIMESPHGN